MENENGGKNVVKACNKLYSVYGHDAAKRTCQNGLKNFDREICMLENHHALVD